MTILFDFDEVIVNINTNALNYINDKLNTSYTIEDVKTWDFYDQKTIKPIFLEYLLKPDLYQKFAIPNKQMIGLIKQLIDSGEDVYILTASVEGSHESKEKFIIEMMPFFDINRVFVINSSSKYKVKSEVLKDLNLNYHNPIVLVDDGVHNILDMMADVRHKEKLDGMMEKLYATKRLSKFNNPYHDFIYGIIPELPYNKTIDDGKRIFKIKETTEIWKLLKNIKNNHKSRVSKKQNEIFFYFNELLDLYLSENEDALHCVKRNKLVSNTKYLVDYYLYNNDNKSFLNKLTEICIKSKDLSLENVEKIFSKTQSIFGQDVIYQEIKDLIKCHIDDKYEPTNEKSGSEYAKFYGISTDSKGSYFSSVLTTLESISQENLMLMECYDKNQTDCFLKEKSLLVADSLEYKAGLLKALNEDLSYKQGVVSRNHSFESFLKNKKKMKIN